jgi:hypothetical protein
MGHIPFMWILKKKYDYWWKKYGLEKAFWQKLGYFIETKAKKLPTSPDLVSPGCARHIFPAIVWFDFEY